MDILKTIARTGILLACSVMLMLGVLAEGVCRVFGKIGECLSTLDDKLEKRVIKKTEKTSKVPTKV